MTDKTNPRRVALVILMEVLEENKLYHTVLRHALKQYEGLSKQDRAFITRICTGTIEHKMTIDYVIDSFASTKVAKMKPVIRNILRMSVYQFQYLDQIPESAICNEAVKLTKKYGFTNLSGFVNGILRSIMRDSSKVSYPDEQKEPIKYFSIKYSIPEWLVEELSSQYGRDTFVKMCEASFETKDITIRCNLKKTTPDKLKEALLQEGVMVQDSELLSEAFLISGFDTIDKLECFRRGEFFIQDESSMLVGLAAGIKKDDIVLDTCASPGGKTMHAAEKAKFVYSQDVSEKKAEKIKENISRYQIDNVKTRVWDATKLDENLIGKFDVVIADVPCSGLGVFKRKPDIKYKVTKKQLVELVEIQRQILDTVHQYVKPGGTLIYSTCTTNRYENIENVTWFTSKYPYQQEPLTDYLPQSMKQDSIKEGYLQLIPGIDKSDGFFLARLKRR